MNMYRLTLEKIDGDTGTTTSRSVLHTEVEIKSARVDSLLASLERLKLDFGIDIDMERT